VDATFVYAQSPIKAWCQVTWSTGVSTPAITNTYNISSIQYINRFLATPYTWSNFAVSFLNDIPSTDYIVLGDGYQPYGDAERAGVLAHPIYSYKTTSSFTMSIVTSGQNEWFRYNLNAYPGGENAFITFQVLGQ
jgi:hypothetical protein